MIDLSIESCFDVGVNVITVLVVQFGHVSVVKRIHASGRRTIRRNTCCRSDWNERMWRRLRSVCQLTSLTPVCVFVETLDPAFTGKMSIELQITDEDMTDLSVPDEVDQSAGTDLQTTATTEATEAAEQFGQHATDETLAERVKVLKQIFGIPADLDRKFPCLIDQKLTVCL